MNIFPFERVELKHKKRKDFKKMRLLGKIRKKREERRLENEKMMLMAELQKTKRMIKAAEYAFDYAIEKEEIDRTIAVISENQRKYTNICQKLRKLG